MKLSIIIPVLNSHEILRRQFLYLEKIGVPDDTEIIIVDDGSEPPLFCSSRLPVRILKTNDKRQWTWALARNAGARIARGDYFLFTDIDHILTREAIDTAREFGGVRMGLSREFGVLLEDGTLTQDREVLEEYGLLKSIGLKIGHLPNNFCMKKTLFEELGGYREDLIGRPYPQGEDNQFFKKWKVYMRENKAEGYSTCPRIYMFPNGYFCGDVDFNPKGLFHKLSRKTKRNSRYKEERNG
jgi:hypothetical protein